MSSIATRPLRFSQEHALPRVLLVDDRPENLLALEATLEPLGVHLVRAQSPEDALDLVSRNDFAVIILDVQMPGMDGYEVARRIKGMAPPRLTPIIFVTALDRERRQVHAGYESGAVDYLFKPLDPDVLRQKVAAFVRLYEEQEAEARRQRQRYADLTEDAALNDSRYRTLFESLDEGFCILELIYDARGTPVDVRYLETNPAFVRQSGLADAVGHTASELMPNFDPHRLEPYARVVATGESARFQTRSPAQGDRWFDIMAFRIGRAEDHHVAVLFTDITREKEGEIERERLRDALDLERERLADVFRQAPVAVAVLRGRSARELVYELVNPRYVEMLLPAGEPVGRRVDDVVPERSDAIFGALQTVLDTGQPFLATDFPIPLDRDGDGVPEEYYFNFVYHPLVEADRSVSGVVAIGTEVTETVRARREAERLQHEAEQARDEAERAHRRTTRLQALTAALAGTRTVDDVAAVVVAQATEATGAITGMLALREPDGEMAEMIRQTGLVPSVTAVFGRFPLTTPGTAARCMRTGEPQWVRSRAELLDEYPLLEPLVRGLALEAVVSVPLVVNDAVAGALSFTFAEPREFAVVERELFLAIARQTAQAIERAQLIAAEHQAREKAEAAERRLAFLAEASAQLAGSLDVEATLGTIAELAVPALADWCFVEVLDGERIRQAVVKHVEPEMVRIAREVIARFPVDLDTPYGAGKVLRTGEPELASDITDEALAAVAHDEEHLALLRAAKVRSSMSVPLKDATGRAAAVLSLVSTDPARRFDESDLAMAMELARRAGAALANARLVEAERAARADAEAASRTKSEFLATMSHELRTPLNAIAGHVQIIEMGIHGPVSDAQRDALVRVERAQRHLLGLINDVLNYARMEAGRVEYDLAPMLARDMLSDVLPMVESQVSAKQLTLETQLPRDDEGEPMYVWADRDKLAQVLLNVLSNAVKFTQEGGRITIALAALDDDSDRVAVRITDTGVGIPSDKLEAVFEPFVQVRSDYTRQVEGTGLGLAISRDLARGMGGDLRVSSVLGAGSTFELVLRRVVIVGGAPVERRSRADRRVPGERRSGEERRQIG